MQAMAVTCMSLLVFNFHYFVKTTTTQLTCALSMLKLTHAGVNGTVTKEKRGFEPDLSALPVNLYHAYIHI